MAQNRKTPKNDNLRVPELFGEAAVHDLRDAQIRETTAELAITVEDIDFAIVDLLENGLLSLSIDGAGPRGEGLKVPVLFIEGESGGTFSRVWPHMNADYNVPPPYIALARVEEKKGTQYGERFNIPNKRGFTYLSVPTFKDGLAGFDYYQHPQPTTMDLVYEIRLVTQHIGIVNEFSTLLIHNYTDAQLYINVKGNPFSTILDDFSAETSPNEETNGQSLYVRVARIIARVALLRAEDIKLIVPPNRVVTVFESEGKELYRTTENQTKWAQERDGSTFTTF